MGRILYPMLLKKMLLTVMFNRHIIKAIHVLMIHDFST